uniref:Uncharacterized protein n=1 Tax=Sphaerodactylus townsendi TaxID=933632 RepID=A0ACB8GC38_9SAUR
MEVYCQLAEHPFDDHVDLTAGLIVSSKSTGLSLVYSVSSPYHAIWYSAMDQARGKKDLCIIHAAKELGHKVCEDALEVAAGLHVQDVEAMLVEVGLWIVLGDHKHNVDASYSPYDGWEAHECREPSTDGGSSTSSMLL